jgi:hypothetical protein
VFQTASGKPHSRYNVWSKLKLILKFLGLQPGGFHAFRHGRVSMLQANGMPGDLLLEQVRHSNLKTTFAYSTSTMRFVGEWRGFKDYSHRRIVPMVPSFRIFERRTCHVTCSRMKGLTIVGEWLSLVEHLVRDQGVGGSNPLSPTNLSLALSVV